MGEEVEGKGREGKERGKGGTYEGKRTGEGKDAILKKERGVAGCNKGKGMRGKGRGERDRKRECSREKGSV